MNEEIEKEKLNKALKTEFFNWADNYHATNMMMPNDFKIANWWLEKLHQRDEELEKLLKEEYAKGYAQSKRFQDEKWRKGVEGLKKDDVQFGYQGIVNPQLGEFATANRNYNEALQDVINLNI